MGDAGDVGFGAEADVRMPTAMMREHGIPSQPGMFTGMQRHDLSGCVLCRFISSIFFCVGGFGGLFASVVWFDCCISFLVLAVVYSLWSWFCMFIS